MKNATFTFEMNFSFPPDFFFCDTSAADAMQQGIRESLTILCEKKEKR